MIALVETVQILIRNPDAIDLDIDLYRIGFERDRTSVDEDPALEAEAVSESVEKDTA